MDEIKRFRDHEALAQGAADAVVRLAQSAIQARGRFNLALAGGSTPEPVYRLLATTYHDRVDWSRVHLFWGDERMVPPDDEASNYRMVKEAMLDALTGVNVYRIETDYPPEEAAQRYGRLLREHFDSAPPQFDLILLGIGQDGHTASLFPETMALQVEDRWVVANPVPAKQTTRITLTYPLINQAHHVIFLASGADKARILQEVINGPYLPETYPAQAVEPVDGKLYWYVDDAASELI
jgi:6-phosphogluconolactonase